MLTRTNPMIVSDGAGHEGCAGLVSTEDDMDGESTENRHKVIIIEPRNLFSQCLLTALRGLDSVTEFVLFPSVAAWKESPESALPCVVLLGISREDGATESQDRIENDFAELQAHEPPVKFMIMSDREEPMNILKALDSGAHGYIPTSLSLEVVIQVLQLVRAGGIYVPASSLVALANLAKAKSSSDDGETLFSSRQLAVAKALRKGMPNKVIAYELNMCESTVKIHVRNIMKKLKAKNRTEAALLTSQLFPDASA